MERSGIPNEESYTVQVGDLIPKMAFPFKDGAASFRIGSLPRLGSASRS
jgi:hypothetical protein